MKTKIMFKVLLLCLIQSVFVAQQSGSQWLRKKGWIEKKANQEETMDAKAALLSLPGKSANYNWNSSMNIWNYNDSTFYTYSPVGQILTELNRNGSPTSRTQYTYNLQGNPVQVLNQYWNFSSQNWENTSRTLYTYDSQNNQTEYRFEQFDNSSNSWELFYGYKDVYTYDGNNRITDHIMQSWDNMLLVWENNYRETAFIYAGNNPTQFENRSWNGLAWENDSRIKLVYDLTGKATQLEIETWNGTNAYEKDIKFINLQFHNWCGYFCEDTQLSYAIIQIWDPMANQFKNSNRITVTFDPFGGYVQLEETYQGNQWENFYRYSYFVDNQYREYGFKQESWDTGTNSWEIDYHDHQAHSYDANFNLTQTIWQYWNDNNMALENVSKKEYSDFTVLSGLSQDQKSDEFNPAVFPNPAHHFIQISCGKNLNGSFRLYDLSGALLSEISLDGHPTTILRSGLAAGLYYYELREGNRIIRGKVLFD